MYRSSVVPSGCSPAEILVSNPSRGHRCLSLVSVVCYQVEVSATSWSPVQRNPTDCGASLYVIYKPHECGDLDHVGAHRHENKIYVTRLIGEHENKQKLNMARQNTSTSGLLQLTLPLYIVYLIYFECNSVIRCRFPTSRYLVSVYVHVLSKWTWWWLIHEVETSCKTIKDRKDHVACEWKYQHTLWTGIILGKWLTWCAGCTVSKT